MAKTIDGISADKLTGAIRKLEAAKGGKYAGTKGVHVVFSGLNAELRRKGVSNPTAFWEKAEKAGIVQVRGAKGGAIAYVAGEMPARTSDDTRAKGVLD